jgi:hypothetical protein
LQRFLGRDAAATILAGHDASRTPAVDRALPAAGRLFLEPNAQS